MSIQGGVCLKTRNVEDSFLPPPLVSLGKAIAVCAKVALLDRLFHKNMKLLTFAM